MENSVSKDSFHRFVLSERDQAECCLAALAFCTSPVKTNEVRTLLVDAGLREAKTWNISRALNSKARLTVYVERQWSLSLKGKEWATNENLFKVRSKTQQAEQELRALLSGVVDEETNKFLSEAVSCLEFDLKRSAVVMSWLAAFHVLKLHVFKNFRVDFDQEIKRIDAKWKPAKNLDDYSRLKERDFLDRSASISVISKNAKAAMIECLDRRNSCGHPGQSHEFYA